MVRPPPQSAPEALQVVVFEDDPRLLAILARHLERLGPCAARDRMARTIVGLPLAVFAVILLAAVICSERAHPVVLDADPTAVHAVHRRPPR